VEPVVKIVGPGPVWVAVAKKIAFGVVGIDSIAGASESLIIADEFADAELIAADMLSQAEHTGDNTVILLTPCKELAAGVAEELDLQLKLLQRADLTRKSLADCGAIVVVQSLAHAVEIAGDIAPEHLQLMVEDPFALLEDVRNAGCIFLGRLATVPLGDYAAGPSHVLPTNGTARFSSPLSANDFLTVSSVICANDRGFSRLASDVIALAEGEGLTAHAEAIRKRKA
jgi:histidinol dehydrogenase